MGGDVSGKCRRGTLVNQRHCTSSKHLVTHLIGFVYLIGGPGSILNIVLLHLGTNFRTGSNVARRLQVRREEEREAATSKLGESAIKA